MIIHITAENYETQVQNAQGKVEGGLDAQEARTDGDGLHLPAAARALVEDLVHSLGSEGLLDENAAFLLVHIFIISQGFPDALVDLINRHSLDILHGEDLRESGMEGDLTLSAEIPGRRMKVITTVKQQALSLM